ncbi:MAG TPA: Gfo/Idh/MocA family oxidoreductase [Thermomicrobiales bacterium]|jgi:predicted dehydrogenase|nr:Gfo/Idh/MocA family oxidoreductase [Thermomicrobiales bacterium]
MIRIGIVGSDNSHALAFARLVNCDRALGERCRVVGLWGAEPGRTEQVAREGAIPEVVARPEDMVGQVDLAMVVDRHGDLHAGHALPFLTAGVPTFVDKPFAIDPADCDRMLVAAQASGAPLASFSALQYAPATDALAADLGRLGTVRAANLTGPCDFASEYGGPYFYATHLVEIALRLLGEDLQSVSAHRVGGVVSVRATWGGARLVTFAYLTGAAYHFHVSLFGEGGMAAREVLGGDEAYAAALGRAVDMAETGVRPLTDDQLVLPIAFVRAIERSLRRDGVEVDVRHEGALRS